MITAQPAKFSRASSSARKVLTSKSLVGSSKSNTLPPSLSAMARWSRFRSPPERTPTFLLWSPPAKLNRLRYARAFTRCPPSKTSSVPSPTTSKIDFSGSIFSWFWSTYEIFTVSPTSNWPASGANWSMIILKIVVLPAPLGPIIPTIPAGGSLKFRSS